MFEECFHNWDRNGMQPLFRQDLICAREEQQGVIFYKIDDPSTGTQFQLYEIEYLIAQKMDGATQLELIAQAVRQEHNFDISLPDLKKFVEQLLSMGFVTPDSAEASSSATLPAELSPPQNDAQPPTLNPTAQAPGAAGGDLSALAEETLQFEESAELSSPPPISEDPLDADTGVGLAPLPDSETTGEEDLELRRLLRTAFLHIRQNAAQHGRDHLLAAQAYAPSHPNIRMLCDELPALDALSPEEGAKKLWRRGLDLFPEIIAEVDSMGEKNARVQGDLGHAIHATDQAVIADKRLRLKLIAILASMAVCSGAALFFAFNTFHLWEDPFEGQTAVFAAKKIHVYAAETASSIKPNQEAMLHFPKTDAKHAKAKAKNVEIIAAKAGETLKAGDVIAVLKLSRGQRRQWNKAQARALKSKNAWEAAVRNREKLSAAYQTLESERQELEAATPKSEEPQKEQLSAKQLKKKRLAINRKLTALTRKLRKPRALENKTNKRYQKAQAQFAKLKADLGDKILSAPFAGVLKSHTLQVGAPAPKDPQSVAHLIDPNPIQLTFKIPPSPSFGVQPGGEVWISINQGEPASGKLISKKAQDGYVELVIALPDPNGGAYLELPSTAFRLATQSVDAGYAVPTNAVLQDEFGQTFVYLWLDDQALRCDVRKVGEADGQIVLTDVCDRMAGGNALITELKDRELTELYEGAPTYLPEDSNPATPPNKSPNELKNEPQKTAP